MTRTLFIIASLLGAGAIIWMASGFIAGNALALLVTLVIAAVYGLGLVELVQFRRATASLTDALASATAQDASTFESWLTRLHPSLQNAVGARIAGERVGLPAPVFTPYLVGLLVMLGLLGTFVGMVETLNGAVLALSGSTELEAIRSGLAAPIQGLGLAFGTSVAGVAASAMLGLNSTLCRRERMIATRTLDHSIQTLFREQTLSHRRQTTFDALQAQAHALPELVGSLALLAERLEHMSTTVGERLEHMSTTVGESLEHMGTRVGERLEHTGTTVGERLAQTGETLGERLSANQEQFQKDVTQQYQGLAQSVDQALQDSLSASARLAGESIVPVVSQAMDRFTEQARDTHIEITRASQTQLGAFGESLDGASTRLLQSFEKSSADAVASNTELQQSIQRDLGNAATELAEQSQATSAALVGEITGLLKASEALVERRIADEAAWQAGQEARLAEFTQALQSELSALRTVEEARAEAANERLAGLETVVTTHLTQLGQGLEAPLTRLIETAAETPRAAAEVIAELRQEMSTNLGRDNQLLEERSQLLTDLHALSSSLEQSAGDQRAAIETLVRSSTEVLDSVGQQFSEQISAERSVMSDAVVQVAGSAAEVASLGEAFEAAVRVFSDANQAQMDQLAHLGEVLEQSSTRSDEQMSYYVAQAREIIDQSMLSQRETIEELRQLGHRESLFAGQAN